MNFLETANVLHRDLKPSNILINDQCKVQICDFGFARTLPEEYQKTNSSDSQEFNLSHQSISEEMSDRKPRYSPGKKEKEDHKDQ